MLVSNRFRDEFTFRLVIVVLLLLGLPSECRGQPETTLISVPEIVEHGFQQSRVVIMNEGHDGLKRSKRSRIVGISILPRAHASGVRYLAAEALTQEIAKSANSNRRLPENGKGYLGQQDMRLFLQSALDLGWDLIAYEPPSDSLRPTGDMIRDTNYRESAQARNLFTAISFLDPSAKVLVWSGNSHLEKRSGAIPGIGTLVPMGKAFWDVSGIEPFSIDQTVTVDFDGTGTRGAGLLEQHRDALNSAPLSTLGFVLPTDADSGVDAHVISLSNALE